MKEVAQIITKIYEDGSQRVTFDIPVAEQLDVAECVDFAKEKISKYEQTQKANENADRVTS